MSLAIKLWKQYLERDALGRLAVIADIFAIAGVSIVTLISAPFISKVLGVQFRYRDIFAAVIVVSVWLLVLSAILRFGVVNTIAQFRLKKPVEGMGYALGACFYLWLLSIITPYIKLEIGRVTGDELLKPMAAATVIKSIENVKIAAADSQTVSVSGRVNCQTKCDLSEYVVVAYPSYYDSSARTIHSVPGSPFTTDYKWAIHKDGTFVVPDIKRNNISSSLSPALTDVMILVLRDADADVVGNFENTNTPQYKYEDDDPVIYTYKVPGN